MASAIPPRPALWRQIREAGSRTASFMRHVVPYSKPAVIAILAVAFLSLVAAISAMFAINRELHANMRSYQEFVREQHTLSAIKLQLREAQSARRGVIQSGNLRLVAPLEASARFFEFQFDDPDSDWSQLELPGSLKLTIQGGVNERMSALRSSVAEYARSPGDRDRQVAFTIAGEEKVLDLLDQLGLGSRYIEAQASDQLRRQTELRRREGVLQAAAISLVIAVFLYFIRLLRLEHLGTRDALASSLANQQRYERLRESSSLGHVVLDSKLTVLDCNDRFASLMHRDAAAVKGLSIDAIDAPNGLATQLGELLRSSVDSAEISVMGDGGRLLWLRCEFSRVADGDASVALRDVTELRMAQNVMADTARRWESLFADLPVAVVTHDANGRMRSMNAAARNLFHTVSDPLRQSLSALLPGDEWDALKPLLNQALAGKLPAPVEVPLRRADGVQFLGTVWVAGVRSASGTFDTTVTIVENTTERRQEHAQLLAQSERQRQALGREINHRIKNNLQGIIGLLQHDTADVARHPAIQRALSRMTAMSTAYVLKSRSSSPDVCALSLLRGLTEQIATDGSLLINVQADHLAESRFLLRASDVDVVAIVMGELLTNAAKHGVVRDGVRRISVRLQHAVGSLVVRIGNEGAFHQASGGPRHQTGQGLELVQALLPSPGASVVFEHGTSVVTVALSLSWPVLKGVVEISSTGAFEHASLQVSN